MARTNTFEGGSDETTITTGNSGGTSRNAFDNVTIGTGASVVYDDAQSAHGTFAGRITTTGTSSLAYLSYTLASVTTDFMRCYYRFTSLPSAAAQPILRYLSGASQAYRVNVKSGGAIEVRDGGNSVVGTTTAVISAGSWFRIEIGTTFSATVGAVTLRLYLSRDSTSITESLTLTGLTLTANATEIRFGVGAALANAVSVWHDNIAIEGTGFFGPALTTGTADRTATFGAIVAGTPTVLGAAARSVTFGTVVSGGRTVLGTAARATTADTAAVGTRLVLGTAARAATFDAAAAGIREVTTTAALTGTFGTSAAGGRTALGSADRTMSFDALASGSVPIEHDASATLTASVSTPTLTATVTGPTLGATTTSAVLAATV